MLINEIIKNNRDVPCAPTAAGKRSTKHFDFFKHCSEDLFFYKTERKMDPEKNVSQNKTSNF